MVRQSLRYAASRVQRLARGLGRTLLLLALTSSAGANPLPHAAAAPEPDPLPAARAQITPAESMPPALNYVTVKFRGSSRVQALAGLLAGGTLALDRSNDLLGIDTLKTPEGMANEAFAAALASDPRVEWAEPVRWRRAGDVASQPDDPSFKHQQWYYDVIAAANAWGVKTDKPPVVAVLDSGVMCAHPDLAPNMWRNPDTAAPDVFGYDFVGPDPGNPRQRQAAPRPDPCVKAGDPSDGNGIDDDRDGVPDGGVFHGTFVAGVVAAAANNGVGVAGICPVCKIMAVRVANPEGWTRSDAVASGLAYATSHGAQVINLSFGGAQISRAEQAAIDAAVHKGVVVVAAAGNDGGHPIAYPAALPNVIAVGATDHNRTLGRATFSNWGAGTDGDRAVDVVAPGVDIVSTGVLSVADQARGTGQAGAAGYERASGTSFAAPMVAGLVGLVLSQNPKLTPAAVKELLKRTATPLAKDSVAGVAWAGAGLINVGNALQAAALSVRPAPSIGLPALGAQLTSFATILTWSNAPGATQNQIQVTPANNDGPGINLIVNATNSLALPEPRAGVGPYLLLPGMSYSWRVRDTTATTSVTENDPAWGNWSQPATFRTPVAGAGGVAVAAPATGAKVAAGPAVLQWSDTTPGVFYYEVQMSLDAQFRTGPDAVAAVWWNLVHGGVSRPANSWTTPPLQPGSVYFWRIRPRIQGDGQPVWWSRTFTVSVLK